MKIQKYICSKCGYKKEVKVDDNVIVRYVKCRKPSCPSSILGVPSGMRLEKR